MKKKIGGIILILTLILAFQCYAYGDDTLNEARELIRTHYVSEVDAQVLNKPSVQEMVYALNDPYSTYIEPGKLKEYLASLDGKYAGVGMYINESKGAIQVINPVPGSPAEKAGVKAGDIITQVNGVNTTGLTSTEVAGKIRGPEGTKVSLTVKRGGQVLQFSLTRETISLPSLEYRLLGPGIGYIQLYSFTSDSPKEMDEALDDLLAQGITTLVLDLRDNPGGLLDVAVDLAGDFVPQGPVVHVVQRGNRETAIRSFKTPRGLPVAVLVNEGTASAAEILAGAIQDAKTGILIGTKTYGKGCVQTIFTLGNGAGLKLTTAKYLTRGRQDINTKGLTPDISEPDTEKQLEQAVKKLGSGIVPFDLQLTLGWKKIFVGYRTYELPVSPYQLNGRIMVPLRDVAQYCGADVRWQAGKVLVSSSGAKLEFDLNKKEISKAGQGKIEGKVVVQNSVVLVPIKVLSDALGFKTGWEPKTKSVYLMKIK